MAGQAGKGASTTSSALSPARRPRPRARTPEEAVETGDPNGLSGLDHLPEPGPEAADRAPRHRGSTGLLGLRCPTCQRVYAGGRGYCPIDAIELGPECEVDLPHKGTITNFAIVTPVPYPGQTETEPFVRAFVLLDGTDVIIPYSEVIELPPTR